LLWAHFLNMRSHRMFTLNILSIIFLPQPLTFSEKKHYVVENKKQKTINETTPGLWNQTTKVWTLKLPLPHWAWNKVLILFVPATSSTKWGP
jgi:hypothetical protein